VIDTVGKPAGPATWCSAAPLVAWAEIAILHRAGAPKEHYSRAAELAKTHNCVLLIESPWDLMKPWRRAIDKRPGLPVDLLQ